VAGIRVPKSRAICEERSVLQQTHFLVQRGAQARGSPTVDDHIVSTSVSAAGTRHQSSVGTGCEPFCASRLRSANGGTASHAACRQRLPPRPPSRMKDFGTCSVDGAREGRSDWKGATSASRTVSEACQQTAVSRDRGVSLAAKPDSRCLSKLIRLVAGHRDGVCRGIASKHAHFRPSGKAVFQRGTEKREWSRTKPHAWI